MHVIISNICPMATATSKCRSYGESVNSRWGSDPADTGARPHESIIHEPQRQREV